MFHHLSRRKFVTTTSAILSGIIAAGGLSMTNIQTSLAVGASANWLTALPDSTPISQLSIPGTHDTCALKGGAITVCQTRILAEQLAAGIRCIDIRCRHINDVFAIHHGSVFQDLTFGSGVRDVCINFLNANPGECIIMSVKEEYNPTGNTRSFEDTFDWYTAGLENYWYFGDRIPTLGSVRGKIVLLRRFSAARTPKGIDASNWPDNATFEIKNAATLEVQDQYVVNTVLAGDINAKWTAIKNQLDHAQADASGNWYINFSSGASLFAFPNTVANLINPKLAAYLNGSLKNRVGTLMMDFPDDTMIGRIIALNG